jgi:3-oxoacyl-[acyl-carrier-protein] synthase II
MQNTKKAVITGVGVVSPLGLGWKNWVEGLRAGRSATRAISLFDAQHPIRGREEQAPLACRVAAECRDFQPHEWMDKRDLERVPRVVPMALAATHEALHSAGLNGSTPDANAPPTAVVIGSGGGGFSFAEAQFAHWYGGENAQLSPYAVSSAIAGMVSSEISIAFGLRGRSHTFSDGCTSSSDALGNALDLIRNGRETRIICGGADAPITPATIAAFGLMRAISTHWNDEPEKASRPFSKDRDGFVLGEGAWMFVVEERESALARGAKIWAEIAGYGATCEAYHRVALGAPDEAARAMQLALDDAHVAPAEIDTVNLHGTGTQLNDPLETAAVKMVLGARAGSTPMSATKSQIGHPQGASGAAGVAATLAAMHDDFLPPTINMETPDENCDLDYVANTARAGKIETALCNCLGFGSKNAALVLRKIHHE